MHTWRIRAVEPGPETWTVQGLLILWVEFRVASDLGLTLFVTWDLQGDIIWNLILITRGSGTFSKNRPCIHSLLHLSLLMNTCQGTRAVPYEP